MSRIRSLKPDFFRSRSLAKVSFGARLTFQGLWCEADDAGNGRADPRILKGAIWPLDDDVTWSQVQSQMDELVAIDAIRQYVVDGEPYYSIPNWTKHQSASNRRGKGWHPAPATPVANGTTESADEHDSHDDECKEMQDAESCTTSSAGAGSREQVSGSGEQGGGTGGETSTDVDKKSRLDPAVFEAFWKLYPKKKEKPAAKTAFTKACKRATPEVILAGVECFADAWKQSGKDLTYVPYPQRWLNNDRWADEPDPPGGLATRSANGNGRQPNNTRESLDAMSQMFVGRDS